MPTNNLDISQSDFNLLQEKGFTLEKVAGEGSYAKVRLS